MDFDVELFLSLCKEYNIPLTSANGKCQILIDGIPYDFELIPNINYKGENENESCWM